MIYLETGESAEVQASVNYLILTGKVKDMAARGQGSFPIDEFNPPGPETKTVIPDLPLSLFFKLSGKFVYRKI